MFSADNVRFLDAERIGRISVPAVIRLDIDGKTDVGIDIMVSAGGIIVNIRKCSGTIGDSAVRKRNVS